MLRGNISAKIDDQGRLKIPALFRATIEEQYGTQLFITSLTGEHVSVYPMQVWMAIEEKLAKVPTTLPARGKFLDRVNYFGQPGEFDKNGRVSIHGRLRESAAMVGDVDVFGQYDYLDVWNHERFTQRLDGEPFTDEDARSLSEFGI